MLACIAWFCGADSHAEPPGLRLTPGVTCLTRTTLEESLDRALDRRFDSTGLEVEVVGSAHDPRSALIRLSLAGEPLAQRAFSPGPPRCADFHGAIALAIALMIKNSERELVVPTERPREPAPTPPEPPAPTPRELRAPPLRSAPIDAPRAAHVSRERDSYWGAQAAGVLGPQITAPLSAGLTSDVGYAGARFGLQLGLLALFSTESALGSASLHYRTRPIAASLTVVARLLTRRSLRLRASLGFLAGRVRTEFSDDSGRSAADHERVSWFAGRAALELALPLAGSLQLVLSAGPLWNVRKLGVSAYDADSGALIASERFAPVGALLGVGLAYERGRAAFRQGSSVVGHP